MYARSLSSAVIGLVVAVSSLGALAADDPVMLSWKFKKGDQRHYVAEQKTSTETEFQGQTITGEFTRTFDMRWAVDSVGADGTAQLALTITRVRLKTTSPGAAPIEYDSSSKEAPPAMAAKVAAVFKPLVGKPINLKMSPRGVISEITLPEASILHKESFKELSGASTLEFADHPVKKGDAWKRMAATPSPDAGGKRTTDVTYTFQGTEKENGKQIDKIDMTMKTSIAPGGKWTKQITDQQSEGKIDFDHVAGHIIQSRAKAKTVMTSTVRGTKVDITTTSEVMMRLDDGADDQQGSESAK